MAAPALLAAPSSAYDLPIYASPKVHRDHHIEVAKALYSVPGNLIGTRVEVRADAKLVKVFARGQLVSRGTGVDPGHDPAAAPERSEARQRLDAMLDRLMHQDELLADVEQAAAPPPPKPKRRPVPRETSLVRRAGPRVGS